MRQTQRKGTWNERELLQLGKPNIFGREIIRYDLSVCGLRETHWRSIGRFLTETYTVHFSGSDSSSANEATSVLPNNLQVLNLTRHQKTRKSYILLHPPAAQTTVSFYTELENSIKKISKRNLLFILDEFNGKIESNANQFRDCTGRLGVEQRIKRGERLIQFAEEINMTIKNNYLQYHPR